MSFPFTSFLGKRGNGDNGCDKVSISKCCASPESLAGFGRKGKTTEIFLGDRDGMNWRKCWHPGCLSQQGASQKLPCRADSCVTILVWPLQFSLKLKTGLFPAPPTCKLSSMLKALLISVLTYPRWDDNLWVLPYTFHPEFVVTDWSNITFMIPILCSARALDKIFSHLSERKREDSAFFSNPQQIQHHSLIFYGLGRQLVYILWIICLPY